MEETALRLNKYLSQAGICSRREADRLIASGQVQVNGETAALGDKVMPEDTVQVNGEKVTAAEEAVLLAYYKPRGIVCTFEKREPDNIIDAIQYPRRITYAGRLDKDSEGLMILTNQGDLIQEMMRARNEHEKEYIVTVDKPVTLSFLEKVKRGIWLEELGVQTRPCRAELIGERKFRIVLTQGINRQIRRMCRFGGYHVRKLVRVRIMNIQLGSLEKGKYRNLTEAEIRQLYQLAGLERKRQ